MKRVLLILVALTVASTVSSSSQEIQTRRIAMPNIPLLTPTVISSGKTCWALSGNQGLVIWSKAQQRWKPCASYSLYSAAVAYSVRGAELTVLRTSGDIERCDADGNNQRVATVDRVKNLQSVLTTADGDLIEAGTMQVAKNVVSSMYVNGSWHALDTIPANNPVSISLVQSNICSSVVMTIIDRLIDGTLDTTSYRLRANFEPWFAMEQTYPTPDFQTGNGATVSLQNRNVVHRLVCSGPAVGISSSVTLDQLVRISTDTIVGFVQDIADTNAPSVYLSVDGGNTFAEHPAFAGIQGYVHGVGNIGDGELAASIGGRLFLIKSGHVVDSHAFIESTDTYPNLVPLQQSPTRFFALHSTCCIRPVALYDMSTDHWHKVIFENGAPCSPQHVFPFAELSIVNDGSNTGVLRGNDTVLTTIRGSNGVPLEGQMFQCLRIADDSLLLYGAKRWYVVTLSDAKATLMTETDWPRIPATGYSAGPYGGVVIPSNPQRIVAGTGESWTINGSDTLGMNLDRYGILVSTDAGKTWMMSNDGIERNIYCWDMERAGDTIYTLMSYSEGAVTFTRAKFFRSFDQGRTWISGAELPQSLTNSMRMSVGPNGVIYVGGHGLAQSRDAGASWQTISSSWPSEAVLTHAIVQNNHLVVATDTGIYISNELVTSVPTDDRVSHTNVYWDGSSFVTTAVSSGGNSPLVVYDIMGRDVRLQTSDGRRYTPQSIPAKGLYIITTSTDTRLIFIGD